MKFSIWVAVIVCMAGNAAGQDSAMFRKISDEILLHGECYDNLRTLCKKVGNRLAGSPAADKAVQWGYAAMQQAGADAVWLQPADVPVWHRGKEQLMIKRAGGSYKKVTVLSLGNSEGTNGKPLEGEIVMVRNFEEFRRLPDAIVHNKIIFFNYRFRQDFVFTFNGYGDAVMYRWASASIAAQRGAKGVIIRSMSTAEDDYPHTGSMHYNDSFAKIPEMALGNYTADTLESYCRTGTAWATMQSECTMRKDKAHSYSVIGEIRGSKYPDKIITVGGHLDSWDVGEGAHDDGAGCVQSIEVLRAFHAMGYRPEYTVRAVLFMNEENGLAGGKAYADTAIARKEQHVLAIETDAGGFAPRGIGLEMDNDIKEQIKAFRHLFMPYGVYNFEEDEGGADISPLHNKLKVPVAGLLPESQRYFDIHHTNNDVFETVNHRELKLGAVVLAQFIYLINHHALF